MPRKKAADDRGFRSPPWRVDSEVVERVAHLTTKLPMSASAIAREALDIGLAEIEKLVDETKSGLGVAAKLGARSTTKRRRK